METEIEKSKKKPILGRLLRGLGILILWFVAMELLLLGSGAVGNSALKKFNPSTSVFIQDYQWSHWRKAKHRWVPLEKISPNLIRAVLVAEDDAFFQHNGLDFTQLRESWEINLKKKRIVRGGSTITMQLIKNLYLTPSRNPIRKLNEILLAMDLESKVSKPRILEAYLNIVEWGEGIFGAQSAAQHYFKKDAKNLGPMEAAYLAAILPNPTYFVKERKSRARHRQNIILRRLRRRQLPKDL